LGADLNKFHSLLFSVIFLVGVFSSTIVLAQLSVGITEGDWIEYATSYTGNINEIYPEWTRMEFTIVQGTSIRANLTVVGLDGRTTISGHYWDLETGRTDLFVISAGLDIGDHFYHANFGSIPLTENKYVTYADAKRTVVFSSFENFECYWDKNTGVLVQMIHSEDNITSTMLAIKTSMWQPQIQPQIFGLDSTIFYALIIILLAIIAIVTVFLLKRR